MRLSARFLSSALALVAPVVWGGSVSPDAIEGIVAWYHLRDVYEHARDGETVTRWPDASGHGHHLTEVGEGLPTVLRTFQVGGLPALRIGEKSAFDAEQPFELGNHTVFVVSRGDRPAALFCSDQEDNVGVLLWQENTCHAIPQRHLRRCYNAPGAPPDGFAITALWRSGTVLGSSIDGRDVSSGDEFGGRLRVGRLFRLRLTNSIERDAQRTSFAELIFYDRALDPGERRSVLEFLAGRFSIILAPEEPPAVAEAPAGLDWDAARVVVELRAAMAPDLNVEAVAIPWGRAVTVESPFQFDPAQPTRLSCSKNGTRLRLQINLGLVAERPEARLVVAVQRNFGDYVGEAVLTRALPEDNQRLAATLETSLTLDEGDYIEIVTARNGGGGEVKLGPDPAVLRVALEDAP